MSSAQPFKGISLTAWNSVSLSSPRTDLSVQRMKAVGADTVALCVWEFQDDLNSTIISRDFTRYSCDEASTRNAIRRIKAQGLKVMLKPSLDVRDGSFRGDIPPSLPWFASYKGFVARYADMAAQEGVDILCVGAEFSATQSWDFAWRDVIAHVRSRYSGQLIYSSNFDCWQNVTWWDALDQVGIAAYYELTAKNDPTMSELRRSWKNIAAGIASYRAAAAPNKPIVFTEAGFRSIDGANRTPWLWGTQGTIDLREQADCYKALLTTLPSYSWWGGVFWWNWECDPDFGGPNDGNYSPQNKPAENILKTYWLGG